MTRPRATLTALLLVLAPVVIFLLSFLIGRYPVPPLTVIRVIAAQILPVTPDWPAVVGSVVLDVRLPRVIAAMLVGGGLAMSGACYQGVFRNPLVSPFTLGVSAGAGFGAAVAILLFQQRYAVQLCAFAFGLAAVGLCFFMSRMYRAGSTLVLVLAGVIVGSLFTALLSLLKYVADPNSKLPVIEFWLLGSLSSVSMADIAAVAAVAVPCAAILLALRWRINLLAMGDEQARILGVLGPNGIGKSTLRRCLAGLVPPTAGTVRVAGRPIATLGRAEIARHLALVRRLARQGLGIIFTTHAPDHAHALADRTLILSPSHPPQLGPTAALLTEATLSGAYGVPIRLVRADGHVACVAVVE